MRKYLGKTAGVPAVNVFAVFRERRVPAGGPGKVFAGITITLENKLRTMKNTVTYLSALFFAASVSNAQHVQLKSDAGNVVCSLNAMGKSVIAGRHVRATRPAQAAGRVALAIPRHRDRPRPIPF